MNESPYIVDVVETIAEAEKLPIPPLLIIESITKFLHKHGLSENGFTWSRIGEGQSNITYQIQTTNKILVLRRGPRPPIQSTTHDMIREARIQRALKARGFAVPRILAVCEDLSYLGVPFYIMEFVPGVAITSTIPAALNDQKHHQQISLSAIDTLVALHQIPLNSSKLKSLGKPEGYLSRQVQRFSQLWSAIATREIPQLNTVAQWLAENIPTNSTASIIHGDYRLGNILFNRTAPVKVNAVLDWEMATLGDPLADLGYFLATYTDANSAATIMELTPVTTATGFLSRQELTQHYLEKSGIDLSHLHWYETLALWKSAIFCEAIYARWLRGEHTQDPAYGASLKEGIPKLIDTAAQRADIATHKT